MENFYPIFKDAENSTNPYYKDEFPTIPFSNKPKPPHREEEYKRRLEEVLVYSISHDVGCHLTLQKGGFTRVFDPNGCRIKVRCVGVWETVGSLGLSILKSVLSGNRLIWNRYSRDQYW